MTKDKYENTVIIISDERDAHIDFVTKHLTSKFLVVDIKALSGGDTMSFEMVNDRTSMYFKGDLIEHVCGVWFRKPTLSEDLIFGEVKEGFVEYSRTSITNLWLQLFQFVDPSKWVSHPSAIYATKKFNQLARAKKIGFHVAETLMTSDPDHAKRFLEGRDEIIIKPLADKHPIIDGHQTIIYTRKLKASDALSELNSGSLHVGPVILQEPVDIQHELRVTVVGDKVFAATMKSHNMLPVTNDRSFRDNRMGNLFGEVDIKAFALPSKIEERCLRLTKELNLKFSAIDLILDNKNNYWFLELNSNGQWAFVEEKTGQPIGAAMASLLEADK